MDDILEITQYLGFPLALLVLVWSLVFKIHHIKSERKKLHQESKHILYELKTILQDAYTDDEELLYEIDLSLGRYYGKNSACLISLHSRIQDRGNPWYYRDKKKLTLDDIADLLLWVAKDIYYPDYEEEERIRIWSQNVPEFFRRYSDCFDKNAGFSSTTMMPKPN